MQEPGGAWKSQGFPLGKGYEVFDAEFLGVVQALQVTRKTGSQTNHHPADSQATIVRPQHTQPGPGQILAV